LGRLFNLSTHSPLAALALVAGTSAASASYGDQQVLTDLSGPTADGCRGLDGTESGTLRSHFEFRQTNDGGSYSLGSIDQSFTSVFGIPGEQPRTEVYMDKSTVYDADGRRLGAEVGKDLEHISIDNQPPLSGPPAPEDTIHVQFVKGGLTCAL
jgi:hypothetical protein